MEPDPTPARDWAAFLPGGVTLCQKRRATVEQTGRAILHRWVSE